MQVCLGRNCLCLERRLGIILSRDGTAQGGEDEEPL